MIGCIRYLVFRICEAKKESLPPEPGTTQSYEPSEDLNLSHSAQSSSSRLSQLISCFRSATLQASQIPSENRIVVLESPTLLRNSTVELGLWFEMTHNEQYSTSVGSPYNARGSAFFGSMPEVF